MFPKCSKYSEAKEQLKQYEQYDAVQSIIIQGKKLKKIALIFHSWELLKSGEVEWRINL